MPVAALYDNVASCLCVSMSSDIITVQFLTFSQPGLQREQTLPDSSHWGKWRQSLTVRQSPLLCGQGITGNTFLILSFKHCSPFTYVNNHKDFCHLFLPRTFPFQFTASSTSLLAVFQQQNHPFYSRSSQKVTFFQILILVPFCISLFYPLFPLGQPTVVVSILTLFKNFESCIGLKHS